MKYEPKDSYYLMYVKAFNTFIPSGSWKRFNTLFVSFPDFHLWDMKKKAKCF